MAIKHVVTRGYGFADGTDFIPTRGYSSGAAAVITGQVPLTLHARAHAVTLETRTPALALHTRSVALTLPDR